VCVGVYSSPFIAHHMEGLAGLSPLMFTLWSHCYYNLLSSTCFSQPLQDLEEGQRVRERRRLAATARVVWVHVCGVFVCRCFYAKKAD